MTKILAGQLSLVISSKYLNDYLTDMWGSWHMIEVKRFNSLSLEFSEKKSIAFFNFVLIHDLSVYILG